MKNAMVAAAVLVTAVAAPGTGRFTPILWHGNQIPIPESPSETHESPGVPVTPASLYLPQLRDRLGAAALKNIGR